MIVIQDDFYPNPDEVRKKALELFFFPGVKGKKVMFAGQRTQGSFSEENRLYCKNKIAKLINRDIITFPTNNSNAAFTLGKDKSDFNNKKYINWVHHDRGNHETFRQKEFKGTMFAAVCYLTPDSPDGYGTGLFQSRETGKVHVSSQVVKKGNQSFFGQWKDDNNEWRLHTYSEHLYNRIIIYPATYWHAPFDAGFGHDKYSGRLIQVFFFWAESSGLNLGFEVC